MNPLLPLNRASLSALLLQFANKWCHNINLQRNTRFSPPRYTLLGLNTTVLSIPRPSNHFGTILSRSNQQFLSQQWIIIHSIDTLIIGYQPNAIHANFSRNPAFNLPHLEARCLGSLYWYQGAEDEWMAISSNWINISSKWLEGHERSPTYRVRQGKWS